MTSDYLKQLQLTKQLEQKTKEAAKNRKAAEDRIAEAERSLAQAEASKVETGEARKLLVEAKAAFARKDYAAALTTALGVLEDLGRAQSAVVNQVLSSAQDILGMIADRDEGRAPVDELIAETKRLLAQGRTPEAMAAATKAREGADMYADRRMSAMFAQVRHLIDVAEGNGLAVSARRQTLAKAIKLQGEGDRDGAMSKLGSTFKGLQDSFTKVLDERTGRLQAMLEEVKAADGDVSVITTHLAKARAALGEARIEESLDLMSAAEGAITPVLIKAVQTKLALQDERSNWLRLQGINITRYVTASRKANEAASAGQGEDSFEWLRRSEKALRDCEAELVLSHIDRLRPLLFLGRRINADLGPVLEKLEEARAATIMGRGKEALDLVSEASAELEDSLAGFQEVVEELQLTKAAFLQARRMHIVSKEAGDLVARSRAIALSGKLREAVGGLAEARALVVRKVQDRCARDLLNGELLVTTGWSIGATVDDHAAELDLVAEDLMEGSIENITARLAAITKALEDQLAAAAGDAVRRAGQPTGMSLGPDGPSQAHERYERARSLLQERKWYQAYALAQEAIEERTRVQRDVLVKLKVQASSLLEIGRKLGVESQTLNEKMVALENARDASTEEVRSLADITHYARSLITDELTRSVAQLMRSSAAARKNGVTTGAIDKVVEDASRALGGGDLEQCFGLLREAEKELEKTSSLHNEVYDLIVLLSRLAGELQLAPNSRASQLLQETKRLYEAGKYDGARVSARACYQEVEKVGAQLLAPRKIQEARDLVPVVQQLGLKADTAGPEINAAQNLLQKGQAVAALAKAKAVVKSMNDALERTIATEIAATKTLLAQGGLSSNEGSGAMGIVSKAESLVADRRYSDALRAIRFARNEAGQLLSLRNTALQELEQVVETIREVEGLGIDIREAREVLEQAKRYRSSGRFNLMVEIARRALHSARTNADDRFRSDIDEVERACGREDLRGADLDRLDEDVKAVLLREIEQHRYTEARKALEIYRDSLKGLVVLRGQCVSSLSKLAEDLVRVPRGSLFMAETEKLMTQAQTAFKKGGFREALALTEECRAAGSVAMEWHDRCARRLEEAHQLLTVEGRGFLSPEIATLMASGSKALNEGVYEDMDWTILKAVRLHGRARRAAARQGSADLVNLIRLFPPLGLKVEDLPPEARGLLDMPLAAAGEVRNLPEIVGAVRARVRRGVEGRIAQTRSRMERSKVDTAVSRSLLAVAERSLAEDKFDQAIQLVQDSEMAIGAYIDEIQEMRALGHRFAELQALARDLGLENGRHRDLYRLAVRSPNVPAAVHKLKEAITAAEHSLAAYLPRLEIGPVVPERAGETFVPGTGLLNVGAGPALQVRADDGAKEVPHHAEVLWPQKCLRLSAVDRDGGRPRRYAISYRALFVTRPLTIELTG